VLIVPVILFSIERSIIDFENCTLFSKKVM